MGVLFALAPTGRHVRDLLTHEMTRSVRSDLLPVWTQVEAPTPRSPYWHDEADGQRRHVHELIVGAASTDRRDVEHEHAQAIATIATAAMDAWRAGDCSEARRLAHAAARLSEEIVGFWPTVGTN